MKFKRLLSVILSLVMVLSVLPLGAAADFTANLSDDETIEVSVGVYDYTAVAAKVKGASKKGVVLKKTKVEVPFGTSAVDAVKTVFEQNSIESKGLDKGYVEEINGLGAAKGYSGWCMSYNDDDFSNYGLNYLTLSDGDSIEFHYSCNFDTTTDDIGNGWYGLPIITELEIGSVKKTFSKVTTFDESYNASTKYFEGGREMSGSGKASDPFVLDFEIPYGKNIKKLSAEFETSLDRHYRDIDTELDDENDYTEPLIFCLSTKGGVYNTYYKVNVKVKPSANAKDKISFRLIGAEKGEGGKYVTWIKTTTYSFLSSDETTVLDVFEKALGAKNLAYSQDGGYIYSVTAPSALGKYELAAGTNGENSGWLFYVNSALAETSMEEYVLEDADSIVVTYVNDFLTEVSDWLSEGDDKSGCDNWLDAKDVNPEGSKVVSSGSSKRDDDDDDDDYDDKDDKDDDKDQNDKDDPASEVTLEKVCSYAKKAADYLTANVEAPANSSVGGEWSVIALSRGGFDENNVFSDKYYKSLVGTVEENKGIMSENKYTEYSRVCAALGAIGRNAAETGGYDLIAPLYDTSKVCEQGLNGAAFAVISLVNCAEKNEKTDAAVKNYTDYILSCQNSDKGFSLVPKGTSDADVTAIALQALSLVGKDSAVIDSITASLGFLSGIQDENGGFASKGTVNAETTAQVMIALSSLDVDLDEEEFVKNGKTVFDALVGFAGNDGGFSHAAGTKSGVMPTEQALLALVCAEREMTDKTSLYDFSDVKKVKEEADKGTDENDRTDESKKPHKHFDDVDEQKYGKSADKINSLFEKGVINGMDEGVFAPENNMTRAQFMTVLVRAFGLEGGEDEPFEDVDENAWYYSYVKTAYYNGIAEGVSEKRFSPEENVTLEQAAVLLARCLEKAGISTKLSDNEIRDTLTQFADYTEVSDWAKESLSYCYKTAVLDESEEKIQPKINAKRAKIAEMLYNVLVMQELSSSSTTDNK